jgi:prepilin-type N-terminal cleavage/methylation domain-containing protein
MRRAVTLVELLIVVSVLAILAGGAYVVIGNVRESSRSTKLEADVAAVNRALDVYEAQGGSGLPGSASTKTEILTVLEKLKKTSSQRMPGLSGRMIDPRLTVDMQSESDASGSGERALWNGTTHRFVIATAGGTGIESFALDDTIGGVDYGTETRTPTLQVAQVDTSHWVWDYRDRAATSSGGSTDPTTSNPTGTPPPTSPTAQPLSAPTFSEGTGDYALKEFAKDITLTNPNPRGSSLVLYSVNGGANKLYLGGTISVNPGDTISTYAKSVDPDHWTDSSNATSTYTAIPVTLVVKLSSPVTQLSFQDAGGAMDGIATSTAPDATLEIDNTADIPSAYQSNSYFELLWTNDGSDPLTSASAHNVTFSAGSPTTKISLGVGQWPTSGSLELRAAAKAINTTYFNDSDVQSATISRTVTALTAPTIDPPTSYRSADFPIAIYKNSAATYPSSYRIYYTTDGSDPGNSGGNPVTGTVYSGAFQLGSSISAAIVQARIYAPSTYAAWFTPSPLDSATYSSGGSGSNIVGAFVSDASINGTFQGSIVLSNPHNFNFNSGAKITNGNLYVVGTPSIVYNGGSVEGRQFLTDGTEVLPATDTRKIVDLNGSADPSNYKIILNNGSDIAGKIYRRATTFSMPTVSAPPDPSNSNNLNVNSPLAGSVDPAQYANVNLNNGAGTVTLQPGNYGNISAGSGTTIQIGVAGSTTPTVYNFQGLTLNSSSKLEVLGPVILTIKQNININSGTVLGNVDHPEWLSLNIYSGNFQINSDAAAYAMITAPTSTVNLNGTFRGGVIANYLTINGDGVAMTLPVQ